MTSYSAITADLNASEKKIIIFLRSLSSVLCKASPTYTCLISMETATAGRSTHEVQTHFPISQSAGL